MSDEELLARVNARTPHFISMLGGHVTAVDADAKTGTMEFDISRDFCHSIDVVQGGFITAMLDATMSHTVLALDESVASVSSLEIKTSFLEPTRAGYQRVVAEIVRGGYKTAFMEARLYNGEGALTATASSVAKLIRGDR